VKRILTVDDHLVIHDATVLGIAGALGGAAGVVSGSPEIGAATAMTVAGLGISAMSKIGPVRRTVNRAAIAVSGAGK
jgi:hypothetical protein